ncbi:DUF4112 domain-containing protein [Halorientalis marina]|uniref:DUF4112 domain-containing protein n=1 Tax=Halorientalis marina TaxID=2931976 RepID=UPI001FF594C6|nr:DUF4112 domain-containing protein [Halorientalis marina]
MTSNGGADLSDAFDDSLENIPESVDRAAIERMQTVAYVLDDSIRVPGTDYRVGLDPLLGSIPVVGDIASGAFSLYIVLESARLGVGYTTLLAMIANVSLDVVGGTIPYVGTVFDVVWKANKRNLELVLEDLTDDESKGGHADDESSESESGGIEIEVEPTSA